MNEALANDNRLAVLDHSRLQAKSGKPGAERGRISVRDVDIVFDTASGPHVAVQDASLTIRPGEFICLLGPSGCGKSTLMNTIAGFVKPTSGEVKVDGEAVTEPGPDRGMVFQQHSLFPWKTVKENVAFGPLMSGVGSQEASSVARTFLSLVGLAAFENAYPNTLSGGMQQRVGIARALANYPSVLLMDEPFGALDAQTRVMMQENLLEIWREFRNTVVFVTHDIDEAVFLSDRIVVMSASPGKIIADIDVDLPRPREQSLLTSPEFMALKRQCLDLIRKETLNAFKQQNGKG
ncbi:NitT/TauT family transport system ATP-binding protein [Marinobacter sp. DSM 26671]|jgi:sulfonate transport system ATP-binding protein|uniref:ABC transporter ATP-binding protein n=1 Tax=Marinobacter metalliresistant TaxID=2961995 RepID=A0ABZ2VZX6_9GAMM|nr:ABC transporter ATP-binding protein [Marinobacter sp. DSM 26671]SFF04835.1 NitT/TauT family transport system ATP-binding protein [Marinobacter sp. DSM 26671]|tara:strand:+ start:41403 stop:42281 length:879 start_codon:yes stop_codon:yes gene_type:complete